MVGYEFLDEKGTFRLSNPELTSYLYFPIANESGVMSSVTPTLGGDCKMGQNTFILAPVSSEDLHNNKSSRNFWCNVKGKGIWSATGRSAKQEAVLFTKDKEETVLEAGLMWHKVKRVSKEYGITSEITSFVPYTKDTMELMIVTIKNSGAEPVTYTPTAAIPLYGRSADNIRDHRHVTSLLHRVEVTEDGVILNPTLTFDERGHQNNSMVYGVFGSAMERVKPMGFYPVAEGFIGEGGNFENPKAIQDDGLPYVTKGFKIDGYEAFGGIRFSENTLAVNEEITYIIVLGFGTSKESLEETAMPYLSVKYCRKALEETRLYWENKLNITYKTGKRDFDTWMQWVNFQPILRRIYGCSFLPHHDYGKGGRGWRDLWQDCLALLLMNPRGVQEMLFHNFAGVRVDGSNATIIGTKQGEFIADRNNITRVWMDHGAWPFLTTYLYIKQSGDLNLLLAETSYFKDPQAVRGEEKDTLWKTEDGNILKTSMGQEYRGSILEHMLIQHLTAFYDVGEHNHIRLRGADWNDALDMAKDRGESVAFTFLYGANLEQMADLIITLDAKGTHKLLLLKEISLLLADNTELYDNTAKKQELLYHYCRECKHTVSGDKIEISCKELADNLKNKAAWIKNHTRRTEWITNKDGYSWFNSYYDNNGLAVEGDNNKGVRMMLTGQVFAIMSHTADEEQVKDIITAADTYLYDETVGGYKLNTDFGELKTDLGRMFGFAYGSKENGAVFSHMAVMYANALYQRNFVPEGYKVINSLYSHLSNFNKSRTYPGIPEYVGDNGRGLYHYLTGSASWLLLTVLNEMFGVKGELGNLKLDPKLLLEQFDKDKQACVEFIFADRKLKVMYYNKNSKEYGAYRIGNITINGKQYDCDNNHCVINRIILENLDSNQLHSINVDLI
ncbi:GH36-type glycosyl hydrolase domain-containing protein [Anaerocolumna sp. MB42-C2]|uniref:GH36-type glycosyl hydrolase domain-containing protein n=1 Tax=Anaerocolumna sp. MB42-C2 TaxID=3070997 RepID=UPI0027E17E49|nr:cellobiose phosphorylase [Anaerocolumna sp. MB42-C2]WMJ87296.1 cellobiose phosphorylase [Anaerocolumna sp. MB42-C2]